MCRYPHSAQPASHRVKITNAPKHLFNKGFLVSLLSKETSIKIDYIERKRSQTVLKITSRFLLHDRCIDVR